MSEISWDEWRKYRALLDNAQSEKEKEDIRSFYLDKYGDGVDPDDDRVMRTEVFPDDDTLSRYRIEMFEPELKPKN